MQQHKALCKSMAYFDLNVPFLENTKSATSSQNQNLKQNRLKSVIRCMEFGYTGVAYNRTIKGIMSDADYCSIPLFTASSLMKLLPALSASAKFHRDLLGVIETSPFRQYTRLTVRVDSASQAMLLNSTNPVLKSYNVVAAKPLNQNAFDQACQFSEVDIISIDFTDKLPFRLRQPIIKAAIKRGVYFEITYYGLIKDVQTRCQVISNAKLLVDWTSGKNIILTGASSSANELRGPYDIVNLASLLGMSMERAKAAVSKNCRNLLNKALRKRQYHNEAIKVEPLTASDQLKFSNLSSGDWLNWDPMSSGQGDLLLDDVEKCFLASSNHSNVKATDFTTIMDDLPSNGLQLKDILSGVKQSSESRNLVAELSDKSADTTSANLVLFEPKAKDAPAVNTSLVESQEKVAEFSKTTMYATNVEPLLANCHDTEAGDDVALSVKDTSWGVEKLVLEQLSQTPTRSGMVDDLPVAFVEHLQSETEIKDVVMTDSSSLVDLNGTYENFGMSTLNRSTESKVLINPVAIIKESANSNISQSRRAAIFPLKHMLNHTHFKSRMRKVKGKAKKV